MLGSIQIPGCLGGIEMNQPHVYSIVRHQNVSGNSFSR